MRLNTDVLARSRRTAQVIKKRFSDLYEVAPEEEELRGACFRVAAFEILTEEQWQQVLNRTRHLIQYVKRVQSGKS